jgi:hypothetical protein
VLAEAVRAEDADDLLLGAAGDHDPGDSGQLDEEVGDVDAHVGVGNGPQEREGRVAGDLLVGDGDREVVERVEGELGELDRADDVLVGPHAQVAEGGDVGVGDVARQVARVDLEAVVERGRDLLRHPQAGGLVILRQDGRRGAVGGADVGEARVAEVGRRMVVDDDVELDGRVDLEEGGLGVDRRDDRLGSDELARELPHRDLDDVDHGGVLGPRELARVGDRGRARVARHELGEGVGRRDGVRVGVAPDEGEEGASLGDPADALDLLLALGAALELAELVLVDQALVAEEDLGVVAHEGAAGDGREDHHLAGELLADEAVEDGAEGGFLEFGDDDEVAGAEGAVGAAERGPGGVARDRLRGELAHPEGVADLVEAVAPSQQVDSHRNGREYYRVPEGFFEPPSVPSGPEARGSLTGRPRRSMIHGLLRP